MKKINKILMVMLAAVALTACTDDQALPPIPELPGLGEEKLGNGDWNSPMAAAQAALGTVPKDEAGYDKSECWVTGYIVGWVNVNISNANLDLAADFTVPAKVATNLMIASDPNEKDPTRIATVQLPGGEVRSALNLLDHPDNLGAKVTIYGVVGNKYCGQYGVRNVSDFMWGDEGKEPDPSLTLPAGACVFYNVDLTKGMQGFRFDQGTPSKEGFETWTYSAKYGIVAKGGDKSTGYATDATAISPVIDLTNYSQVRLMVHQAANYFTNTANFLQMTSTMVREEGTTDWKSLELPCPPAGNSWTYGNSGYIVLDDYAGKKIEIGFRYTSTASMYGTWEIDNVSVAGVYAK